MATSAASLDIPGYHYDEITNRYFKQPPGHFSQLPAFSKIVKPSSTSSPVLPRKPSHKLSLYSFTQKKPLGFDQDRSCFKYVAGALHRTGEIRLPDFLHSIRHDGEFNQMEITQSGDGIVFSYNEYCDEPRKEHIAHCSILNVDDSAVDVEWSHLGEVKHFMSSVSSVCTQSDYLGQRAVLWAYTRRYTKEAICSKIVSLDSPTECGFMEHSLEVPPSVLVVSPYSAGGGCVYAAVAEDESVHVVETEIFYVKAVKQCSAGGSTAVLCLAFAQEGNVLYAGSRNGAIRAWDLHDRKPRCVLNLKETKEGSVSSSVIAIHPLNDSNYFISSAYNSKLSMWDVRMGRTVLSYRGHVNEYHHSCKSIVDSEQKYLFAVGSDKHVRIWSVGDGQLLNSIHLEDHLCTDHTESPPALCYTDTFGGRHFNPTLIVSDLNRLVLYSL